MREAFSKFRDEIRDLPEDKRREKFREFFDKMRKDAEDRLSDILTPRQKERLDQISRQVRVRYGGASRALSDGSLAEDLGITDKQKEELKKVAEELQKEMQEKLAKMREDAQAKILKVLTPSQRSKYKKLIGEPFEYQRSERRFGDRGRGRGGDRRGGGGPPSDGI